MALRFEDLEKLSLKAEPYTCEDSPDDDGDVAGLPEVLLPRGTQTISASGFELGRLLAVKRSHFSRGNIVVRIERNSENHPVLVPVKDSSLASDFEAVANLWKSHESGEGDEWKPAVCSKSDAKLILDSRAFQDELPRLTLLSRTPILVECDGCLQLVVGYHEGTGIFAEGRSPPELDLMEAGNLLKSLLEEFCFATASDRSRALAAFITPALVFGKLLQGRAPIDLGEADKSQTGKGYRNKLTAAIYGYQPTAITQQNRGVGSLEESFDTALIMGHIFISIDNVRDKLNSPKIESFATENTYFARCPFMPNTEIDPTRVYLMLTSNKADVTVDFANRCSCVRLLKQPDNYVYRTFPEGGLIEHVKANQERYLGAVFAVIKAWYTAGKPRAPVTGHDFREWAQTLSWIVEELLHEAPLLEGHRQTLVRMTPPALNWLRDVCLAVIAAQKDDSWLITSQILDIVSDDETVEIPGVKSRDDVGTDTGWKTANQQIGRRMGQCFKDSDTNEIDGVAVERRAELDADSRPRHAYRFTRLPSQISADELTPVPTPLAGNSTATQGAMCRTEISATGPANKPADDPLTVPLMNPAVPPDPASDVYKDHGIVLVHAKSSVTVNTNGSISGSAGDSGNTAEEEFVFE